MEEQSSNLISKLLAYIDYFGYEPQLLFNNSKKHRTSIGGFASIIVYILIAIGFLSFGRDLWEKQQPTVITSDDYIAQPQRYNLTQENFNFYVGYMDAYGMSDYIIDNTLVNLTISHYQVFKKIDANETVNFETQVKNLRVEVCDLQTHFSYYPELFKADPLKTVNCINPEDSKDLFLEGSYGTDLFSYILITINSCRNNTDSGVVCRSESEINDRLSGGYFAIDAVDTIFDPKNYTYVGQKIKRDFFTTMSNQYFKEYTLYYRNVDYYTDIGWLINDLQLEKFLRFEGYTETIDFRPPTDGFVNGVIRLSYFKDIYDRRYTKIQEVVANVGGLVKGILMIFSFLLSSYQSSKFYIDLANKIYCFLDINQQIISKPVNSNIELGTVNVFISNQKIKQLNPNVQIDRSKLKHFEEEINLKKEKLKLHPKCCDYFKLVIPFCRRSSDKSIYYDKIQNKMKSKNNIVNLLNLYEEFSLMKKIFLDNNQRKLFELNAKAYIFNSSMTNEEKGKIILNEELLQNEAISRNILEEIIKKYDEILKV